MLQITITAILATVLGNQVLGRKQGTGKTGIGSEWDTNEPRVFDQCERQV